MFGLSQIEAVIHEWLDANIRRKASLAQITLDPSRRGSTVGSAWFLVDLGALLRTSR
jgi:hypothetical protein